MISSPSARAEWVCGITKGIRPDAQAVAPVRADLLQEELDLPPNGNASLLWQSHQKK
jgi:hypothetical protein